MSDFAVFPELHYWANLPDDRVLNNCLTRGRELAREAITQLDAGIAVIVPVNTILPFLSRVNANVVYRNFLFCNWKPCHPDDLTWYQKDTPVWAWCVLEATPINNGERDENHN